jgi:hypothetical protein
LAVHSPHVKLWRPTQESTIVDSPDFAVIGNRPFFMETTHPTKEVLAKSNKKKIE